MRAIVEHTEDVGAMPIFWREAPSDATPVLYVHGVPDSSDSWVSFLERSGGIAVDLPGFGRSAKRGDLDFSIAGYDRFLELFLRHLNVDRLRLVVHDWGAAALAFAQRFPERIERLVVVDAVPLLPGYRWHPAARVWRLPLLGEALMGATSRWSLRRLADRRPAAMPPALVDDVWSHFDGGTQRAILRLYRSAPPDVLARAGARLGELKAPALVLYGEQDPYIPAHRFARAYAEALGGPAEHEVIAGTGHWPWLDRPELVDRIVDFATA